MAGLYSLSIFFAVLASNSAQDILTTEHPVWDVSIVDVNDDGHNDVVALTSVESSYPPEKHVVVFWGDVDGRFDASRNYTFPLNPASGNAFFSEVDGQAPPELVAVDRRGFRVYAFESGAFIEIDFVPMDTVYPVNTREPLFLQDVSFDLDGDDRHEWLVPGAGGYNIWSGADTVRELSADIAGEVADIGGEYITYRVPRVRVSEIDGFENPALVFLSDRVADFHYGRDWRQSTRYRIPLSLEQRWDAHADLNDINADGWPDLMVTQTEGTVNMNVLTQIYLGQPSFTYGKKPEFQIASKGGFSTPVLVDLNNDDMKDLVVLSIPFSVRNIASFFIRKKVSVRIDMHLQKDGTFPEKPSFRTQMTMEAPDGRERLAYAWGDFNDDGYLDAAIGHDAKTVQIHTRSGKELLASKAWKSYPISGFGVARALDIDGAGGDDLLIFHPGLANSRRIDIVHFSP